MPQTRSTQPETIPISIQVVLDCLHIPQAIAPSAGDRSIENTDLVVWHTLAHCHSAILPALKTGLSCQCRPLGSRSNRSISLTKIQPMMSHQHPRVLSAQREINSRTARCWKIVNPGELSAVGYPRGYILMPGGENSLLMAQPSASITSRAAYCTKHLWVTRPMPQSRSTQPETIPTSIQVVLGLPAYTAGDRSIENTDLVVWHTLAHCHSARAEDWPVMPESSIGFTLQPINFFDENPAKDVPPAG
jgi:Cu2+-containing amine oxidase